ncbi:unnamed protein product [Caenorhabditis sp. 36 PRJEB53466]|nr:unnamed protein product [Caenorhabditis sp. 36 PRJEB53466]
MMMMADDEHFWAKNGRPSRAKDQDRNAAANYIMRDLKTDAAILKTYHLCENSSRIFPSDDISPDVRYSLNKKKRWEAEQGKDLLEVIQKAHGFPEDVEIILLDRTTLCSIFFSIFESPTCFQYYQICQTHQLLPDDSYRHTRINSVYGQPLKNLRKTDDSPAKDIIAYHFVSAPKNYENLLKHSFRPGSSKDRSSWRTLSYLRRTQRMKNMLSELRHEELEDLDGKGEDVFYDDYLVLEKLDTPRQFYNWDDHIVADKFVFVRRKQPSKCSSNWSLVSFE